MSSRKKPEGPKPKETVETKVTPGRLAKLPEATVSSRHGTEMVSRQGRGFSMGEITGAGLSRRLLMERGVPVDVRRRSVLDGNLESLKQWGEKAAQPPRKKEGRVAKAEEKVAKVEKVVEREVVELKKEAVRVERATKRGAVKAEKAAKARVKKPKRPKKKTKS